MYFTNNAKIQENALKYTINLNIIILEIVEIYRL